MKRSLTGLVLALAALSTSTALRAALNTATSADSTGMTDGAAAAPAKREPAAIQADLQSASQELQTLMPAKEGLLDPAARAKAAPAATPVLWKMVGLFDEMGQASPQFQSRAVSYKYRFLTLLSIFDDAKAEKALAADAASADPSVAMSANLAQLSAQWVKSSKDAGAQTKILDSVEKMINATPEATPPATALLTMSEMGAATPDMQKRTESILAESTSPVAKQVQAQRANVAKLAGLENKPLTIEGKTLEGKDFSSSAYKGKVILVDFWASWCGPCKAELPRVKQIYKENHDKGFEIVGVSCDRQAGDLISYLKADPDMSWVQLFTPGTTWSPLATQFGIDSIPRMFLIDRNGVCRTVEARQKLEELLPTLLAEKTQASAQ